MKKIIVSVLFVTLIIFLVNSCKHHPDEYFPIPNGKDTTKTDTTKVGQRPCSPDSVYFAKDIQPILTSYCAGSGCHNSITHAEGIDLSSYSKTMQSGAVKPYNSKSSEMYEVITETNPNKLMPPSGALPADKIALLKKWIDQGAKNLWCDDIGKPCDTTNVTYSKTIAGILNTNCNGCHGVSGGVTLTNYNGVKAVVNNGKLWKSVNHLSGAVAMPSTTTKLSDCNLNQIRIWIAAGAPQN